MGSHITDWKPGRVTKEYKDTYDQIFRKGQNNNASNNNIADEADSNTKGEGATNEKN